MSIKIDQTTLGPLDPSKDPKPGNAKINSNQAMQEPGEVSESSTATKKNSTADGISKTARLLQQLDAAIAQEPTVDPKKIATALEKIRNGTLANLESAERIAAKLLAADTQLPSL